MYKQTYCHYYTFMIVFDIFKPVSDFRELLLAVAEKLYDADVT